METNSKYALVTGATSGIGFELAKLFANDHYNLVIVARNEDELQQAKTDLLQKGVEVVTILKDLSKKKDALSLCNEIKNKGIQIDALVNDAGQGLFGLFKDTDLDRELDIINLNIGATVILTKHFIKEMVERNDGKILNLASVASKIPGPWQSVYHGSKAFVLSFTEAIRKELKDTNVTITALLPGVTNTDFFNKAGMQSSKIAQDKNAMSDPADVAKDGYEALMAGKDKVVSGFKNKMQVLMANISPDSMVAHMTEAQQHPVEQ